MLCLNVYMCTTSVYAMPGALGVQKRASEPLEPELQTLASCHVGAGDQPALGPL